MVPHRRPAQQEPGLQVTVGHTEQKSSKAQVWAQTGTAPRKPLGAAGCQAVRRTWHRWALGTAAAYFSTPQPPDRAGQGPSAARKDGTVCYYPHLRYLAQTGRLCPGICRGSPTTWHRAPDQPRDRVPARLSWESPLCTPQPGSSPKILAGVALMERVGGLTQHRLAESL